MGLLDWFANIAAAAGIVLTIAQYWMKTMIPLRLFGIASNVMFIIYSSISLVWPTFLLNCIVLPLSAFRVHEMRALIRKTEAAGKADFDLNALQPFMTRRAVKSDETLFRKGDAAESMYLVVSGRLHLPETGIEIKPGTAVGELGLLAPGRRRTQGLVALEDSEVLVMPYDRLEQLYFQNPEFGLAFLRLTSQRLFENIARLEHELAARNAELRRFNAGNPA